ncbi:hypothetical protein ACIBO2_42245 [Nonomuraea sp. NPDC050022]|uniref:hypothetical protein n=1 Tax=Nonomuraea sp. NPDC050022 TaxID=3364358 RepID=UPI0037A8BDD5
MEWPVYSPFAKAHFSRGYVEGYIDGIVGNHDERLIKAMAEAVVKVLDIHEITVPQDVRDRITQCTDHDQLTQWINRACTAKTLDEIFAPNTA